MSPELEHSLSAQSFFCRRRCLRHNTGSRSHFPNRIPQTARHVVVGHLIERYGIHWRWHPRKALPFDRRCVNDCACLDQSRSYRPARPRNLVFHRGLPFCYHSRPTSLALSHCSAVGARSFAPAQQFRREGISCNFPIEENFCVWRRDAGQDVPVGTRRHVPNIGHRAVEVDLVPAQVNLIETDRSRTCAPATTMLKLGRPRS
jgi:hypothetical protein